MEKIIIKKVTLNDLDRLQKSSRQTFSETFAAKNTEENMRKYLEEGFSTKKLTDELNNKESAFYFAELNGEVVGLKEFHGKNVGQLLYQKAVDIAREKDVDYVWLGVWEENERAINFYRKNGFVEFDKHIFKLGEDEQTDIMMKLKLKDTIA